MKKNIYNFFLFSALCFIFNNSKTYTNQAKLYISTMGKLAQKKDFATTVQNIVTLINETQDEKLDPQIINMFLESSDGKKLVSTFNQALSNNIFQIPLTTTGLFLYDLYKSNIFESYTKTIAKAFEQYLFNVRNIPSKKTFADVITSKDFVQRHRDLHSKNMIKSTLEIIKKSIELIQNASLEQLTDMHYLQETLLPELGFDSKKTNEFPKELHEFAGKGLQSWQYPIQFAKFLISLSKQKINTYLEIGAQHGGNFIIITEYLKRFNPELKSYAIDPHYYLMLDLYVNDINPNAEYVLDFTNSKRFIDISSMDWDLVALDGDPSFEGTTQTYNLVKKNSTIITINDIVNDLCPGVGNLWNILKKIYSKNSIIEEFTDQYEEITNSNNKKYLGLGVIYMNKNKVI